MIKSSRGSVLITVLLITSLFSILGISLLAINLNHTKQTEMKLNKSQAINVAEMGLKAYTKAIDQIINSATPPATPAALREQLNTIQVPPMPTSSIKSNVQYTVAAGSENDSDPTDNTLVWTIKSIGTAGTVNYPITIDRIFTFNAPVDGSGNIDFGNVDPDDVDTPNIDGVQPPYMRGAIISTGGNINLSGVDGATNATYAQGSVTVDGVKQDNGTAVPINLDEIKTQFDTIPDKTNIESSAISSQCDSSSGNDACSYSSSVSIKGDLSLSAPHASITFDKNVLIDGDFVLDSGVDVTINGYLYVTGNLIIQGNNHVTFNNTVFVGGVIDVEGKGDNGHTNDEVYDNSLRVFFNGGLASNQDITLTASNFESIKISVNTQPGAYVGSTGIGTSSGDVHYGQ